MWVPFNLYGCRRSITHIVEHRWGSRVVAVHHTLHWCRHTVGGQRREGDLLSTIETVMVNQPESPKSLLTQTDVSIVIRL